MSEATASGNAAGHVVKYMGNNTHAAAGRLIPAESEGGKTMTGSAIASYPNRVYICGNCGKHLGDRYSRLKGKKSPSVVIINGVSYCSRCADKHLITDPGGISGESGNLQRIKKEKP